MSTLDLLLELERQGIHGPWKHQGHLLTSHRIGSEIDPAIAEAVREHYEELLAMVRPVQVRKIKVLVCGK